MLDYCLRTDSIMHTVLPPVLQLSISSPVSYQMYLILFISHIRLKNIVLFCFKLKSRVCRILSRYKSRCWNQLAYRQTRGDAFLVSPIADYIR